MNQRGMAYPTKRLLHPANEVTEWICINLRTCRCIAIVDLNGFTKRLVFSDYAVVGVAHRFGVQRRVTSIVVHLFAFINRRVDCSGSN